MNIPISGAEVEGMPGVDQDTRAPGCIQYLSYRSPNQFVCKINAWCRAGLVFYMHS